MKGRLRHIYPLIFGLTTYISIRLVTDTYSSEQFWDRSLKTNSVEVGFCIATSYLIHRLFFVITARFETRNTRVKTVDITGEFTSILLMVIAVINPVIILIHYLIADPVTTSDFIIANVIVALYSLLYYAIIRGNHYVTSYIDQQMQLERLRTENLRTELDFLKAQYHPHFIFNALNTIYFQMDESIPDAKTTIEKFAELLRYQLNDHQDLIPATQELDHLDNFIHLQKQRAAPNLDLQVNYDSKIKQAKIYPLLLLPLVENAFKYVGGKAKIIIEATCDNDEMCFSVQNSLPDRPISNGNGIGHDHLQKRLRILYPGKHKFLIEHTKHYYRVQLKLFTV